MNSIDVNRYTAKQKRPVLESLFSHLFSKPKPRLAFASGLIFGLLIYALFLTNLTQKYGMNVEDYYGTIGINEKAGFKTLDDIPINLPEINGAITLKQLNNIVGVELDLSSPDEFEILLEFDEIQIRFNHYKPVNQTKTVLESGENYIKATFSGDIQSILFFSKVIPDSTYLNLKLLLSGHVHYDQKILINKE